MGKARGGTDRGNRQTDAPARSYGRFEKARPVYEPGARPEIRQHIAGRALSGARSGNQVPRPRYSGVRVSPATVLARSENRLLHEAFRVIGVQFCDPGSSCISRMDDHTVPEAQGLPRIQDHAAFGRAVVAKVMGSENIRGEHSVSPRVPVGGVTRVRRRIENCDAEFLALVFA